MKMDIVALRERSLSFLDRHPAWKTSVILGALVLFVVVAALPAEGRPTGGAVALSPCEWVALSR